jgi:transcriptional regulator with XRE-family HTH domain
MTPNKIRALLAEKGIRQVSIVKKLGVKPSGVSGVISGTKTSRRIRLAIAAALNIKPEFSFLPILRILNS